MMYMHNERLSRALKSNCFASNVNEVYIRMLSRLIFLFCGSFCRCQVYRSWLEKVSTLRVSTLRALSPSPPQHHIHTLVNTGG